MNRTQHSPLFALALAAGLLGWLAPTSARAQQDPVAQRGFAPEKLYSFGNLDSVNLFNGNLTLTIPIGSPSTVNGALSYGLTLVYNSKVWDFLDLGGLLRADPSRTANAGMGWRLSLGELFDPVDPRNESGYWSYEGEDGGAHTFYPTLHLGETSTSGVYYTRDGSYLRLKSLSPTVYELEFPDGSVRKFTRASATWSSPFSLVQIRDRFNNAVNVTYTSTDLAALRRLPDAHRHLQDGGQPDGGGQGRPRHFRRDGHLYLQLRRDVDPRELPGRRRDHSRPCEPCRS